MKSFGAVLSLAFFLSLTAASPLQARQASSTLTPTPSLSSATASSSATCSCEPRICIQSWPQSCLCANKGKQECYEKCGGEEPELQSCE